MASDCRSLTYNRILVVDTKDVAHTVSVFGISAADFWYCHEDVVWRSGLSISTAQNSGILYPYTEPHAPILGSSSG